MAYSIDDEWENGPMIRKAGTAAFGLYTRCGLYIARHRTDGLVPADVAAEYGTREWAAKLVAAGLWEVVEDGYHDPHYLKRNPSAEKVDARRAGWARKQALFRDPDLRHAIRKRDRDMCRYCGVKVRWNDRRGTAGGTYDHVDPDGSNDLGNLVVACRGCNASKGARTPDAAGMTLLPVPDPDTTQNGSKSRPKTKPVGLGAQGPPSKEGTGAALVPAHPYQPDGHVCAGCTLPQNHRIHQQKAS